MSESQNRQNMTAVGRQIIEKLPILETEILREDYSATVDFGIQLSNPYITQLERIGFEVIHEESSVYTLRYAYEI